MPTKQTVEITMTARSDAAVEHVFDTLADLRTHLEWGGRRQLRTARIRTLDAPADPATVGTRFASVGGFPGWRLHEAHVVTEARRPSAFEFQTESEAHPTLIGSPWLASFVHRYEIVHD